MDIMNYGLREKYEQLKKFGDRLSDMKDIIDWNEIKPLLSDLYKNDTEKGGRPNFDPVFMVKIMFLQSLYGLVDEAMEIELYSNMRFMNFLDYPESVPDARTIWLFRERIANNHKDKMPLSLNPIPVTERGRKMTARYRSIRNFPINRPIRKNLKLRRQRRK